MPNSEAFLKDLERLINHHSMENTSNTPDFILAAYLAQCLAIYADITQQRERWYGRLIPGNPIPECVLPEQETLHSDPILEALSAQLHAVYQQEARRQGHIRHSESYAALSEPTKDYDRALARWILRYIPRDTLRQILSNPLSEES